jgi:hypothetical protein
MSKKLIPHTEKALAKADPQQIIRRTAADAREDLRAAVTAFAAYVDPLGMEATSPAGFMVSINGRLAKAIGQKVDQVTEPGLMSMLAGICQRLAAIIRKGMDESETRKRIKDKVGQEIKVWGEFVQRGVA